MSQDPHGPDGRTQDNRPPEAPPAPPLPDSAGAPVHDADRIDPWRVAALHAALDRPGPAPAKGEPLPPLWHFLFFAEVARRSELGPDGHPAPGHGLIPDTGLPRRMRAGGRFEFHGPLTIGAEARRTSVLQNVALKQGGSGALAIVTVRRELFGPEGLAMTEQEDLVYRPMPSAADPVRPAPPIKDDTPAWRRTVVPDTPLLFRYSALTFNGHRIHYDLPYATGPEGYPGLLVHGPLIAQLLADLCGDEDGRPMKTFTYRAVSPIFHDRPFTLCGRPFGDRVDLWALNPDGRLAMEATATMG